MESTSASASAISTSTNASTSAAVYDYRAVTDLLCDLYRDRAFLRGQQIQVRTSALTEAIQQGANITSAREQADAASSDLERDALKVEGEIACCHAQLRYLDYMARTGDHDREGDC